MGKKVGVRPGGAVGKSVARVDSQQAMKKPLTKLERQARREAKSQSIRVAAYYGDMGNSSSMAIGHAEQNFYSPQLSSDFLELPQAEREKRELFRFWYTSHPIVGASIDFHCFPPGAPVMMKDATVSPVESLKVGDEVVNGFGEPTKVVQTFKHHVCGPITRFKVRGVQSHIDCTENHPFLVYRSSQIDCKHRKCASSDPGKPRFVFARDLQVGDYICSPSLVSAKPAFNKRQLRLLGYYAAEGSISYTKYLKLDRVVFTLGASEFNTIADEIAEAFSAEYAHPARKRVRKDSSACEVRCYKKDFAEFCHKHVGSGSHNKQLSLDIIDSPREDILEFLGAYWNGDGSLTKNGYVATTISKQLAHQIFALALKVGWAPTLHVVKPKRRASGFKPKGDVYRVIVPYRVHSEFAKYANFVQDGYTAKSTREYQVRVDSSVLRRVEEVETVQYDGFVYNIEVDGEGDRKSYVAYGLATHNTDVPMSKIRLAAPKGKDIKRNKQILHFYENMCRRLRLFQTLYDVTHEYWLHGNVFIFCEDHDLSDELPEELMGNGSGEDMDAVGEITADGVAVLKQEPSEAQDKSKLIQKFVQDKYEGWHRLQILPPEQVKLEIFQYTNRVQMELVPSEKDRLAVTKAQEQNDPEAKRIADDIPDQIKDNLLSGQPIPLNASPYDDFLCSSFCYHLAHKRSPYDDRGVSILERCLRSLLYQDKLRQAQTSIASRAMTPKRIIWGDKMSQPDVDDLRDQIDQALIDPDFTIITNFEVHWDEIGARDRLLDLNTEYEITNKMLFIGLRITESMLTGESTYSGERIHLDVMNTMYLLYRETLTEFVEQQLFAPVAEKKGFWEEDEFGNRQLLYPRLQFTRLALRDNTEMQDFMFNLYGKGSMPIDYIYDLLNIDSENAHELLKRDMFGPKDATFNEVLRSMYPKIGEKLAEDSNATGKVAGNIGLTVSDKEGDRFGKE